MRWSDRNEDNLEARLRGEGDTKLGAALTELREHATEPSNELRERIRELAAEEPETEAATALDPRRLPAVFAHAGALAAAVLLIAVAIPIATMRGDGVSGEASATPARPAPSSIRTRARSASPSPVGPPRGAAAPMPLAPSAGGGRRRRASDARAAAAARRSAARRPTRPHRSRPRRVRRTTARASSSTWPTTTSSRKLSRARSARHVELGGYVTYVDYGTSGRKDGEAALAVRVPVGRVQAAVARFSQLGTILEQQTEVRRPPGADRPDHAGHPAPA